MDVTSLSRDDAWRLRARLFTVALALTWSCTEPTVNKAGLERSGGAMAVASGDISSKGAFTQCQNENPGPACNWVTGTLNAVHSKYAEGEVIPFKLLVKNATTVGNDAIHELTISYGFQKASSQVNANYDFQATYDATLGVDANPCLDGSNLMNPFCTSGALKAGLARDSIDFLDPVQANSINLDPNHLLKLQAAVSRFEQSESRKLYIVGGTFAGVTNPISATTYFGATDPSGSTIEARVTFRFKATAPDVMLLWGQHFAAGIDWLHVAAPPAINGAAGQSGSPFHVVLERLDGATTGGKALNVSGDVVEIMPKARVVLSPLSASNSIGESHTVTVTVSEAIDQSVAYSPAVGEIVTYTVTGSNGATPVVDLAASTCDNAPTDANGQCIIVFSSATAGLVTVHAQSNVSVGGKTVLASSGTGGDNSGDALKTFLAGTLSWAKVDGAAALVGGAVFTVCRTHLWNSDLNGGTGGYTDITPDVCVDVSDNVSGTDNTNAAPADRDGTGGEFQLGGLLLGTYTVTEKTPPTGYTKDPDTETANLSTTTTSATIATAFVNPRPSARITIAGAATNGIGESHTFTVTLEKNLGAGGGFVAAAGEDVDFVLTNAAGASFTLDGTASTCDDAGANTNASGQCTIVFTSNSAGTVTGSASASLTVGGVSLTVNTGPSATTGSSANVVKTFVAGSLRWLKHDGAGQLLAGAVFTVCRTANWNSDLNGGSGGYDAPLATPVCGDVSDNVSADNTSAFPTDRDGTGGEFQLGGLILGKYTIVEKTPPAGYTKDPDTENADLSTGTPSATIATAFVNPRPRARVSITGDATNGIGEAHTFTITLEKDLGAGAGFVAASGEHVDFTLVNAGGANAVVNTAASTCDEAGANTNGSGQCTIVFTSNSAGTVTGSVTASLLIGGVTVNVNSGPSATPLSSTNAVKTFVAGSLRWLKHDGVGQLLGGAVFTVCRTANWNSDLNNGQGGYDAPLAEPVCFDVSDNVSGTDNTSAPPADRDGTGGEFQLGGLVLGKYTIVEKTAPAGYIKDADTENADLSTTTTSVTIQTAFVNLNPEAFITIGPATATNSTTDAHTFTAVMSVDPRGGGVPVIGAIAITVSPTPSTLGTVACQAQAGPTGAGLYTRTCTLQINSTSAGTFTANASASATVGTINLTRDTDPATANVGAGPGGSGPAQKTYVAPNLAITKTPDAPVPPAVAAAPYLVQPGGTATFTITVTNTGAGEAKNVVLKDTLPNSGLNWSEANASCSIAVEDIDAGAPVVNRQVLTCNVGTLVALTGSFSVQVSTTVPVNYIQVPPSAAGVPLEIDGNLVDSPAGGAKDWENVGIVCPPGQMSGCRIDLPSGQSDSSFGQGTAEDDPVPTVIDGGVPPEKSDLLRFYVATERFTTFDHLYLAWERVQEPNGTTNMDFEFNQSRTMSSNGFTPVRTAGDMLIKYDLAKGGTVPVLGLHRWITAASAGGQTAAQACEAANKFPCWGKGLQLTNDVAGAINGVSVTDPIAPGAPRSLDPRTFGEARINLQASGVFQPGVCLNFGSAYLKSRSSDSFTSAIKDFIAPIPISINTCQDVLINNRAWASASNFAPSGGNLGQGISDVGQIKVQAPTNGAMRSTTPTSERVAQSATGRSMTVAQQAVVDVSVEHGLRSSRHEGSAVVATAIVFDAERPPQRRAAAQQRGTTPALPTREAHRRPAGRDWRMLG